MERPHTIIYEQALVWAIGHLGDLERLVAIGYPLGKFP
jgi:hypothetical protein